jgi:hypothetical protein
MSPKPSVLTTQPFSWANAKHLRHLTSQDVRLRAIVLCENRWLMLAPTNRPR